MRAANVTSMPRSTAYASAWKHDEGSNVTSIAPDRADVANQAGTAITSSSKPLSNSSKQESTRGAPPARPPPLLSASGGSYTLMHVHVGRSQSATWPVSSSANTWTREGRAACRLTAAAPCSIRLGAPSVGVSPREAAGSRQHSNDDDADATHSMSASPLPPSAATCSASTGAAARQSSVEVSAVRSFSTTSPAASAERKEEGERSCRAKMGDACGVSTCERRGEGGTRGAELI